MSKQTYTIQYNVVHNVHAYQVYICEVNIPIINRCYSRLSDLDQVQVGVVYFKTILMFAAKEKGNAGKLEKNHGYLILL